jgi:hypothetical protein
MVRFSRRSTVQCGLASVVSLASTSYGWTAETDKFNETDHSKIDSWMDAWMRSSKTPVDTLKLSRFADSIYFLTSPITWTPNPGQEDHKAVTVPVGFVTDFASIPQAFWSILKPDGNYTFPAIIHDFLYWNQDRSKKEADEIFKFGMEDFSISSRTIFTLFEAVKWFGGGAWNENKNLKTRGERRVLLKTPDDPRVTWTEWKQKPGVFGNL